MHSIIKISGMAVDELQISSLRDVHAILPVLLLFSFGSYVLSFKIQGKIVEYYLVGFEFIIGHHGCGPSFINTFMF